MDSTSSLISFNTKSLIVILGLTFFFLGLFPILSLSEVNGDSSGGITKLKKLGNKIGDLDFNSGSSLEMLKLVLIFHPVLEQTRMT